MLECLIIGDSLAVGVGQARTECVTMAQTGITSTAYLKTFLPTIPRTASQIVISLGVNDDPTVHTLDNLRSLRRDVSGGAVIWLLPGIKDDIRQAIETVARERGDRVLDTQSQVGPDHLHPTGTGYRLIASWTQDPSGHHSVPARGHRFAAAETPPLNRLSTDRIEPNMSGNLRQYREMPVVIYPNSFNGRVIYGLPGNSFASMHPPTNQLGAFLPHLSPTRP